MVCLSRNEWTPGIECFSHERTISFGHTRPSSKSTTPSNTSVLLRNRSLVFFSFTLKDLSKSSVLKQRRSYPPPANNSTPNDRYLLILGQVCVLCVLNPQAFLIGIGGLWKWFEDVTYQCVTYISTVLKRPRGTDSHEFSPRCSNLQITTYLY